MNEDDRVSTAFRRRMDNLDHLIDPTPVWRGGSRHASKTNVARGLPLSTLLAGVGAVVIAVWISSPVSTALPDVIGPGASVSSGAPPTSLATAAAEGAIVGTCGRVDQRLCDQVADMVLPIASTDVSGASELVIDYACAPGTRCQAAFEVLAIAVPLDSSSSVAAIYLVEGRVEPEFVFRQPEATRLPDHVLALIASIQD